MDPFWGGFGLQRGHFSVKMYAKTKELGPVGGVRRHAPLDPPMLSLSDPPQYYNLHLDYVYMTCFNLFIVSSID